MIRAAVAITALVFAGCQTASAGWPHDQFDTYHSPAPRKPVQAAKPKPRVIYRTITKTPSAPTPGPLQSSPVCQPAFRTVGDQALTREGAKEAADKAFQQQARFTWGERFADVANAKDRTYECVRSSIGSVAGQVFQRCEIRARPCMAPQVDN